MKYKLLFYLIICISTFYYLIVSCEGYEKDMPPPQIFFNVQDSLVETKIGDTIYLTPKITYDLESTYKWYINKEFLSDERNIMHISETLGEILYDFTVVTPHGRDSISLIIRTIELIDFNDFNLSTNNYNIGEDLSEDEGFVFAGLSLLNRVLPEKKWEGFAMSYFYDTKSYPNDTIYSVYGTNSQTNRIFTMLSLSKTSKLNAFNFNKDSSYLVGSIDVCNSTRVYNMIVYGDREIIEPFARKNEYYNGDSLFVRFNGFDALGKFTGYVDFYLADYRFEKNSDVYQIKTFTSVDLSSLGYINNIVVEMFSSLNDSEGNILIPPYVCFDNIKIFDKIKTTIP